LVLLHGERMMDKEQGKKLLLEFTEILDYWSIPFFLIQGTALGAYRDNGFTPTEKDIDIGILIENFYHSLFRKLIERGYEIQIFNRPFTKPRLLTAKKFGCRVDVACYMKWKDKRFASRTCDERNLPEISIVHDASILEKYRKVSIFGRSFNIPNNIEQYLALTYGRDWKTPNNKHALMESSVCIKNFIKDNNIPLDLLEKL